MSRPENKPAAALSTPVTPTGSAWMSHAILLVAAAAVVLTAWLLTCEGQNRVLLPGSSLALPPMCVSRLVWGFDCPGCGLTRGFISIADGQFADAWRFNPASFAVFGLIAVQIPWQSWQLLRVTNGQAAYQPKWIYLVPGLAMVATLGQWVVRMTGLF